MQQISIIGFKITQPGISPPPLHQQQPIWYGRWTLLKPLLSNSILCLFVDGWISHTATPKSLAPSTLPQLMDANPATISPNMTGIFLFDTHEIFRTHLLGSTFHPTPFKLILVFKFHSATLHTSPLHMSHPIRTRTALSPDKRPRKICISKKQPKGILQTLLTPSNCVEFRQVKLWCC